LQIVLKQGVMKATMSLPMYMIIFLTVTFTLLPAHAGFTQDYQDHAAIKEAARNYVLTQISADRENIEMTIGTLDARLRLPRCGKALEAFKSPGARMLGNTSIGVSCNDSTPWKLYVPVKISIYENVLVAKNYLRRGTQIKADDIERRRRDLSILTRSYITEPQQVVGLILKQPLMADAILTPTMFEAQKLVRRGEGVIILAKDGGIEVRMKGKALVDGTNGQTIRVQNLVSQRIVEGQVISRGVISVPM